MKFDDQVALVTGAGSGLGKATALELARQGARLGVLSRTATQIEEVAEEIRAAGGQATALTADVSQPEQMEAAVDKLVATYDRLDIVFANAGINGVWAPVEEITPEEWDQTIDINLKGTFLTIKYSVPHLKKTRGSIAICSSVQGTRVFNIAGSSVYSASKAAQVTFGKKLAVELSPSGVRVNIICPGWFSSEIGDNTFGRNLDAINARPTEFPLGAIPLTGGKPGDPEQIGKLVAFLASDEARHITGTEVWIDGAESLVSG
ncbi:MAG: SDR family oxidoreductase [Candidatus Latescibacteria bacterium]|nr:SDR family oxidoreductase [Candidatus Latescibacterota bacterium]